MTKTRLPLDEGLLHFPAYFDRSEQEALLSDIRSVVSVAPLFVPVMPRTGKQMSVRMTNCGNLGWLTDKERGYRYQSTHPETGRAWPPIPAPLLDLWRDVSSYGQDPEACLINYYDDKASMGLHQDRDEINLGAPVVSVSLGNTCLFRIGGINRNDRTRSIKLESGDVFVLAGASRLRFHGVDRIYPATSTLLKNGGRINLTLRRVNP
ncbi:alpha-ketoglutarate-dependent dioxygenase AlkB family protein [Peteryoungia desertarenae]|uniref:alpha-ketoglutarate-dependent dioxygenase AlkB family protein n=1 Tax=Peteryoungia desertarenae TaxID=1813451 RepID=UPI003CCE5270